MRVSISFSGSHKKYANSYCWIKNTYYLPFHEEIPRQHETEKKREIIYYQWLPFILLLQAVFFYLPSVVWRAFNSKAGVDADDILSAAEKFSYADKLDSKQKTLTMIVNQVNRFLGRPKDGHQDCSITLQKCLGASICCCCGKRLGNYLVYLYIFVKGLYVTNVVGQLFVLNAVLRTKYTVFGAEMIAQMTNGEDWSSKNTSVFPRVTLCDFDIRRLGNVHRYTLQCVLPINMYAEKMYTFLWFWMLLITILTCITMATWVLRACMYQDRVQYIKGHLQAVGRLEKEVDTLRCYDFVEQYLRQDGVFLMRLIGHNTNGLTVSEILTSLWDSWVLNDVEPHSNNSKIPKGVQMYPTLP